MKGNNIRIKLSHRLLPVALILLFSFPLQNKERFYKRKIKYHPGHYVAVGPSYELSEIKFLNEQAVRGINKRYYWRTLEPEKGVYDFSSIENDLNYLRAYDKQLIIFLIDRTFWIKGAMPDYLSEYELNYEEGGYCPVRWHPVVVERLLALGRALGDKFDLHPNFEGMAIQESALDMSEEDYTKFGYTADKYRDALITILTGLQKELSNSHVFWYQNFMYQDDGHHLRQIAEEIKNSGIIMGGPDILPYNRWYNKMSYPMYREYQGSIPLFCSAQDDSYKHYKNDIRVAVREPMDENGYLTMEEIFLFARDSLHVRYLFWNYYYGETDNAERSYDDAIKVIRKYPTFNNTLGLVEKTGN